MMRRFGSSSGGAGVRSPAFRRPSDSISEVDMPAAYDIRWLPSREGFSAMSSATTTPQPGAAAAEAGEADVEFRAVTKRFGSLVAVNAVSLHVHKGEFLSLLGPSGCGKTTSLRMIAGFEQPDEGEILIGGVDAVGTPPYRRDVNTVFQQY